MQSMHLALEPHLNIQNCESILFSFLTEFFSVDFLCSFSYWLHDYTGVLLQLLKKGVSTLLAFENLHEHIRTLLKRRERSSRIL